MCSIYMCALYICVLASSSYHQGFLTPVTDCTDVILLYSTYTEHIKSRQSTPLHPFSLHSISQLHIATVRTAKLSQY